MSIDYSNFDQDLSDSPSFIEKQFPIDKLSMESYAERRSNQSQSITSLGKWWGRKPLVLVRALILGILLPASDNPSTDREMFLALMTMDEDGLWKRKEKNIPGKRLHEELLSLPNSLQERYCEYDDEGASYVNLRSMQAEDKNALQKLVFNRMSYAEKLDYCCRPEHVDGPTVEAWKKINSYFGTKANNLQEFVQELGYRRFGHEIWIGDAFSGTGSIPFEAARIGANVFASDLNPVSALLSWAALNVVGGPEETYKHVQASQQAVHKKVWKDLKALGIEHNSLGWCADAFLYCVEVVDPETGWRIPLAPHWVIAPNKGIVAQLIPDKKHKRYDIVIKQDATRKEIAEARKSGTIKGSRVIPPDGSPSIPIEVFRKNLRMWDASDFRPRDDDVFQERLYCIRWVEEITDKRGRSKIKKHYRAPTSQDFKNERFIEEMLAKNFDSWKESGYLPSWEIEPGEKTVEPIRTRGWTYWHHLFPSRQLLIMGMLAKQLHNLNSPEEKVINLLALGRYADWNSKLCRWGTGAARESIGQTFTNQALNTQYAYATKAFGLSAGIWFIDAREKEIETKIKVFPRDARLTDTSVDIWITDPPYADAVIYDELSEFFLSWYEKFIPKIFPNWYADSKRSLAVRGSDLSFKKSMIECYSALTNNMSENGFQVVMFTHQDASVWADLTTTLWAAGLRVYSAWTIQTEREATGFRTGNYVQGTVLLILRKKKDESPIFLDEISHLIEVEVKNQLSAMLAIDDKEDPNFGDADYQLAAYAAALRVLTKQPIFEIDPEREILRSRESDESNPIELLIKRAVKIAADHLVPTHLNPDLWRQLSPMERFYLKGLEVESHGEYRNGVYQELARGFGANDYTDLLANTSANETRLKRPSEFGRRGLSGEGFAQSLMRQCLFAIYQASSNEDIQGALTWLRTELSNYWTNRIRVVEIMEYLANLSHADSMAHWKKDSQAARLLAGAVRNDHV